MENNENKSFVFEKANYKMLIIGLAVVLLGFILMSGGSSEDPDVFAGGTSEEPSGIFSFRRITLAPIVCIAGYVVVLLAILKKPKDV